MRKICIPLFFLLALTVCHGQNDTSLIYNTRQLKKGFYKSYAEYLHNAPSLTAAFTTRLYFVKSGADSIITGASYQLTDGTTLPPSWGFCDGANVFINAHSSLFKKQYMRAQYIGKHPFFLRWHKDMDILGNLPVDSATLPARYDLLFINAAGNAKKASHKNLKKLFADNRELLKRFTTERTFSNKIKTEYLVRYNEGFMSE